MTRWTGSVTATVVAAAAAVFTVARGAGSATVAVTDDDLPLVSIAVAAAHAGGGVEGAPIGLTATRSGVLDGALTVPLAYRVGTGAPQSAGAEFRPGSATAAVLLAVPQVDGLFMPPRPLTATVRDGSAWRVAGRVQQVAVTVRDDDAAVARIEASRASVTEDLGCAGFTLTLANAAGLGGGPDAWLDVPLVLTQTGAFLAGADPVAVRMRSLSREVCIPLDDDQVAEANGTVTATVTPSAGDVNVQAAAAAAAAATVSVVDDDSSGTAAAGPAVSGGGGGFRCGRGRRLRHRRPHRRDGGLRRPGHRDRGSARSVERGQRGAGGRLPRRRRHEHADVLLHRGHRRPGHGRHRHRRGRVAGQRRTHRQRHRQCHAGAPCRPGRAGAPGGRHPAAGTTAGAPQTVPVPDGAGRIPGADRGGVHRTGDRVRQRGLRRAQRARHRLPEVAQRHRPRTGS